MHVLPSGYCGMQNLRMRSELTLAVKAITQAVLDTLGGKAESVDILLYDIKRGDWATGGELWSEKK